MKERVELLGVPVDVTATQEAGEITIAYIKEEASKVVYFLNSETLLLLEGNMEQKEAVSDCDLILPGAANVDNSIDEVLGHKRDSFFFESYLDILLDYIVEMGYETFLVTEDEQQFQSVQGNIHEKRPFLDFSGYYRTDKEEGLESIVNEINSVAPDVLLIACKEQLQLELLEKYRYQMNAGLVLFVGDRLYHKAVIDDEVPEKIEKFNLNHVYQWFRKGNCIKAPLNSIRMRFRMLQQKKKRDD